MSRADWGEIPSCEPMKGKQEPEAKLMLNPTEQEEQQQQQQQKKSFSFRTREKFHSRWYKKTCLFLSFALCCKKNTRKERKRKKIRPGGVSFLGASSQMRFFFIEIWIKLVEMRRRRRCWRFRKTLFSSFHSRFVFVWWSLKISPGSLKKISIWILFYKIESFRVTQMNYFWLYPIR